MTEKAFIDSAKVLAKGQITIPKDIRNILGITTGDRITFVVNDNNVHIINSTIYATQVLQKEPAKENIHKSE